MQGMNRLLTELKPILTELNKSNYQAEVWTGESADGKSQTAIYTAAKIFESHVDFDGYAGKLEELKKKSKLTEGDTLQALTDASRGASKLNDNTKPFLMAYIKSAFSGEERKTVEKEFEKAWPKGRIKLLKSLIGIKSSILLKHLTQENKSRRASWIKHLYTHRLLQ